MSSPSTTPCGQGGISSISFPPRRSHPPIFQVCLSDHPSGDKGVRGGRAGHRPRSIPTSRPISLDRSHDRPRCRFHSFGPARTPSLSIPQSTSLRGSHWIALTLDVTLDLTVDLATDCAKRSHNRSHEGSHSAHLTMDLTTDLPRSIPSSIPLSAPPSTPRSISRSLSLSVYVCARGGQTKRTAAAQVSASCCSQGSRRVPSMHDRGPRGPTLRHGSGHALQRRGQ